MRAVVLVGGEGTRMRPLTETVPKPLLPFLNRPFLDHVLDQLASHGVDEVICSSRYLESVFLAFLESRGGRPPEVRWITEAQPLGTAGAIAGAREHVDETFLALNGDVLSDLDLGALIAFHRDREAVATIALTPVEDARPFGLVEMDERGRVAAFREKPADPIPGTINAGVYVLEPRALDGIAPEVTVSIERETFPGLIDRGEGVFGFVAPGYWRDLGTPQAYLEGHLDALDGRIPAYLGLDGPLVGQDVRIGTGAEVSSRVVLGTGVRVGDGARLDRAVVHEGAVIGDRARVHGCVVGARARVGRDAELRDSVLGAGARIEDGIGLLDARVGRDAGS